jgi:hypothetical protein
MSLSVISNYGGKQANNTATIKSFFYGIPQQLWTSSTLSEEGNVSVIRPVGGYNNLFIPDTIYLGGSIVTTSDINMKTNIKDIDEIKIDNILNINVKEYNYKNDITNLHYGFIAQEVEKYYPELVVNSVSTKEEQHKSINYLEIIPILLGKVQKMQKEIDDLKKKISINNL